jgi:hypothetical protein
MVSILSQLELCSIDRMTRQELVDAIRARIGDLPPDLLWQLDEEPTSHLQLILLAGRLIHVLRRIRKDDGATLSSVSGREVRRG